MIAFRHCRETGVNKDVPELEAAFSIRHDRTNAQSCTDRTLVSGFARLFDPKFLPDSFDDWLKKVGRNFHFPGFRVCSRGPHHPDSTFPAELSKRAHRLFEP